MAAFLTKEDFKTHVYSEIIESITRGDDDIIHRAIANTIGEMKSYLNRYNKKAMFGIYPNQQPIISDEGNEDIIDPTFTDAFLKGLGLDIACWWLIKLANPNINLELFRTAYEDAIKTLEKIQKGYMQPEFPLAIDDPETPIDESGHIEFSSNIKRNNHY